MVESRGVERSEETETETENETYQVGILLKTDVEFKLFNERRMGENEKYLREKEQCTLYTDLRRIYLQGEGVIS